MLYKTHMYSKINLTKDQASLFKIFTEVLIHLFIFNNTTIS